VAKLEYSLPEEFMDRISRLAEQTDEIVPRVLEAGGEVVLDQVRQNLSAVVGTGTQFPSRSTGELAGALGLSPAKLDRDGNYNVKVGFNEPRRGTGDSNAKIANILEHGRHGQSPKPFLKPARNSSRAEAIEAMKRKMDEEVSRV
jgi:HK97 gp10 family phage protein